MKVALVTEVPAPFRIPLWNALAAIDDVELRVLLLSERDPRRGYELHRGEWHFDAVVLPGRGKLLRRRWLMLNRGLRQELQRFAPNVVLIGGWNQPAFFQAVLYARRVGRPSVVWVESTARDERSGNLILERLKRWLLGGAAGVLVPGRAAAEYVQTLGVGPERITVAPNAVDLMLFSRRVEEESRRRDELRRELGLYGCCVLCVSRLSREKGVDLLVRAFAGVTGELVVIGDGPQEDEVRRLAGPNVRFLGRLRRDELPRWYAAADAFALASRSETWGMALSEAATAGLPLVVSEAVGAAYDLVEPGVNGFRVPIDDEERLREALARIAEDEPFRARAGVRSRELAAGATPEHWAEVVAQLSRALAG
jgi:glycosyltransferase involved in cell wall biosynthesis